jgi:hypothetical protein
MPDISPYGVTQNADAAAITANELVGEPAGSVQQNAVVGNLSQHSTAPYIPPRPRPRPDMCLGKDNTCKAPKLHGSDWCFWHDPSERVK